MSEGFIAKRLSNNDLGITGSHQSGIVVPKFIIAQDFFPYLDPNEYNPRRELLFISLNAEWKVSFIYYNNKLHGKGTRNEYRITGLSAFYKESKCNVGDSLRFYPTNKEDVFKVEVHRALSAEEITEKKLIIRADWAW